MRRLTGITSDQENNVEKGKTTDVKNLTASTVTILSILSFCMWLTYVGTTERNAVLNRLINIENSIESLKNKGNLVTGGDLTLFCLRAQLINENWKCPIVDDKKGGIDRMDNMDATREVNKQQEAQNLTKPAK